MTSSKSCLSVLIIIIIKLPTVSSFLQNERFLCAVPEQSIYLQSLKSIVGVMFNSPVWLFFDRHELILEKERKT